MSVEALRAFLGLVIGRTHPSTRRDSRIQPEAAESLRDICPHWSGAGSDREWHEPVAMALSAAVDVDEVITAVIDASDPGG